MDDEFLILEGGMERIPARKAAAERWRSAGIEAIEACLIQDSASAFKA